VGVSRPPAKPAPSDEQKLIEFKDVVDRVLPGRGRSIGLEADASNLPWEVRREGVRLSTYAPLVAQRFGSTRRPRARLLRAVADLAAWHIALAAVALGVGLMWLSAVLEEPEGASPLETTIEEVGALLVVSGVITVFWDLRGRRALTDEVLHAANLSSDVTSAGLRRVPTRYLDVEWDRYLAEAVHVDLFFAYARTWRMTHATALRQLVARSGTRLRVVLPDRSDPQLMALLAAKFGYTAAELRSHIEDAESDFENLRRQASQDCQVEIRAAREFPVFSYYRFDRVCIGVLYAQARGRTEVPTFECEQGGTLYGFFRDQYESLWATSVRPGGDNAAS